MISREEVEHLAALARLKLGEEEMNALQGDMSNILEYVGQIAAANLEVKSEGIVGPRNIMREDSPREENDQIAGKEASLRAAFPKEENGFNVVRKIIQKDN